MILYDISSLCLLRVASTRWDMSMMDMKCELDNIIFEAFPQKEITRWSPVPVPLELRSLQLLANQWEFTLLLVQAILMYF